MTYLLLQIWVWLLIAAFAGMLFAWLVLQRPMRGRVRAAARIRGDGEASAPAKPAQPVERAELPMQSEQAQDPLRSAFRVDPEEFERASQELKRARARLKELERAHQRASGEAEQGRERIAALEAAMAEARQYESRFRAADRELEKRKHRVMQLESELNVAGRDLEEVGAVRDAAVRDLGESREEARGLRAALDEARRERHQADYSGHAAGKQPPTLVQPDGEADDLTRIRGVGPVMQSRLNAMGIFHFRQIAELGADHATWIDRQLGFPGRVERGKWIEQARALRDD